MKYRFIQQFVRTQYDFRGKSLVTEKVHTRPHHNEHHDLKDDGYL